MVTCQHSLQTKTEKLRRSVFPLRFQFKWSETTKKHNQSSRPHHGGIMPADRCSRGSTNAPVTHLIRLSLLLLLLLLLLVFFLVVALTRFSTGCSCLSMSGLPRGVPSAFGSGLHGIWCVRVRIRVYLKQGEAGGGGGDGDHCRWSHCEQKN